MNISNDEMQKLLSKSEDELLIMLVPEAERNELNSFGGIVARGKIIFRGAFFEVRDSVCALHIRQDKTFDSQLDLFALVVAAIVGQVSLAGIPAVPMAALIVKIGIGKLCQNWKPDIE